MLKLYQKYCGLIINWILLFLFSFLTIQLAAQEDHATTVKRADDGCTVIVTIQLGVNGTAADVTTIRNAVEGCMDIDTCFIPCEDPSTRRCSVQVNITVRRWNNIPAADRSKFHRINMVADDSLASSATRRNPNGPSGIGTFKRGRWAEEYCHEVLHLCGLRDAYCGVNTYDATGPPPVPEWREPVCPPDPGPNPCDCPPPPDTLTVLGPNMRCTKPCVGKDNDIMSDLGTLDCSHILEIVALGGENTCPEDPCCIVPYTTDSEGNVTWGDDQATNALPILDNIPGNGGSIRFYWTRGSHVSGQPGDPHPDYQVFEESNSSPQNIQRRFRLPNDSTITDWTQIITWLGGRSHVAGGNIEEGSSWEFQPLLELPRVYFRIPDLAPTSGDPSLTIYTAVNLGQYFESNPVGFLNGNWQQGQFINDLNVEIVDGQIDGLEGIYWATTDFTFDPDSPYGYVPIGGESALLNSNEFQDQHGNIVILAVHEGDVSEEPIPTLSEWGIILFCLLVLTFGVFHIKNQEQIRAGNQRSKNIIILLNKRNVLHKVLKRFPLTFIVGFVLIWAIWQTFTIGDVFGLTLSSVLLSFIILMVNEPEVVFDKNLIKE